MESCTALSHIVDQFYGRRGMTLYLIIEPTIYCITNPLLAVRLMEWISKSPQKKKKIAQITISCDFEILFSNICIEPIVYIWG